MRPHNPGLDPDPDPDLTLSLTLASGLGHPCPPRPCLNLSSSLSWRRNSLPSHMTSTNHMSNNDDETAPLLTPRKDSMSSTSSTWWRVGAVYGAAAVCLGAFGAHGLKQRISDPAKIASWSTAAHYQVRARIPQVDDAVPFANSLPSHSLYTPRSCLSFATTLLRPPSLRRA